METAEMEHEQIETEEQQETEFNVIPVQLVESYEGVALASASNTTNLTLVKGKYYKQTYRPAWEQMPDFKGAKKSCGCIQGVTCTPSGCPKLLSFKSN